MQPNRAVIAALKSLIEKVGDELAQCEQVIISVVPQSGHGNDIDINTEKGRLVAAEVTTSGAGKAKRSEILGGVRKNLFGKVGDIGKKIAKHRVLFVPTNTVKELLEDRARKSKVRVEVLRP